MYDHLVFFIFYDGLIFFDSSIYFNSFTRLKQKAINKKSK